VICDGITAKSLSSIKGDKDREEVVHMVNDFITEVVDAYGFASLADDYCPYSVIRTRAALWKRMAGIIVSTKVDMESVVDAMTDAEKQLRKSLTSALMSERSMPEPVISGLTDDVEEMKKVKETKLAREEREALTDIVPIEFDANGGIAKTKVKGINKGLSEGEQYMIRRAAARVPKGTVVTLVELKGAKCIVQTNAKKRFECTLANLMEIESSSSDAEEEGPEQTPGGKKGVGGRRLASAISDPTRPSNPNKKKLNGVIKWRCFSEQAVVDSIHRTCQTALFQLLCDQNIIYSDLAITGKDVTAKVGFANGGTCLDPVHQQNHHG
jgi:hypothetical protein